MTKNNIVANILVDDVLVHWDQMSGGTTLAKQLNAFLTAAFILRTDVPHDECESEAAEILRLRNQPGWRAKIFDYLVHRFAEYSDAQGNHQGVAPGMRTACEEAARKIPRLFEALGPVDLETLLIEE